MDAATLELVSAFHATSSQWVLALTGGGAGAAGQLLSLPGGSRTLLEIAVPYHEQALAEFLGSRPDQFCGVDTSRAMARRALERARWLAPGTSTFGLGCTASLASDQPKRGDHRVHVSTAGRDLVRTWSLTLAKGARDRAGEETVASALVLHALARTLALPVVPLPLLDGETIAEETAPASPLLALCERHGALLIAADGRLCEGTSWQADQPMVLVPGAFNPLHRGHLGLAQESQRWTGLPVAFELSMANVDKPELAPEELRRRLDQLAGHAPVWLTRAARFVDKGRLFPGAIFALGADTALRLVDPRYYDGDERRLDEALGFFRAQGCRFLVAGRIDASGTCLGLADVPVPPEHRDLFAALPPETFRVDISSTVLRTRMG